MYVVTANEMRKLDEYVIQTIGIPAVVLMENAGSQIAREVIQLSKEKGLYQEDRIPHWAILVGKGNNGGDGLVAARHLAEAGLLATIIYVQPPEHLTGDAAFQRDIVERLGIPCLVYGSQPIDWRSFDGIVDALLGTGSKGAPRDRYASLITEANACRLPIVAADIPSGLDADTGAVHEPCIQATRTVALAFLKRGLVQYPGAQAAGDVVVREIGISPSLASRFAIRAFLLHEHFFKERFGQPVILPRENDTHKGTYGHLLVCAGSREMSGAGLLCCKAALRAGCGLVTWAVLDELIPALIGQVPEVMLAGLAGRGHALQSAQALAELINQRDAAVIGPGLGRFAQDSEWLRSLWEGSDCPLVLDADALNMIADSPDFGSWRKRNGTVILTPHPGEMARLLGTTTKKVQQDRIEAARLFAARHQVILVLKGARTVVATPEGTVYINPTGNPGMATGGSGDVLSGIIASLLAQGLTGEHAACLGVWLHGTAGDRAITKRYSPGSLIAGDIIEEL